jgi:hypothetical protein
MMTVRTTTVPRAPEKGIGRIEGIGPARIRINKPILAYRITLTYQMG